MTQKTREEIVAECEAKSRRGLGMFERVMEMTFKLVSDLNSLETRIIANERTTADHSKQIENLVKISDEIKQKQDSASEKLDTIVTLVQDFRATNKTVKRARLVIQGVVLLFAMAGFVVVSVAIVGKDRVMHVQSILKADASKLN